MKTYKDITELKRAHKAHGGHFFDKSEMDLFNCRALPTVYGGRYFITESKDSITGITWYLVREITETYKIRTVPDGSFFDIPNGLSVARAFIKKLVYDQSVPGLLKRLNELDRWMSKPRTFLEKEQDYDALESASDTHHAIIEEIEAQGYAVHTQPVYNRKRTKVLRYEWTASKIETLEDING